MAWAVTARAAELFNFGATWKYLVGTNEASSPDVQAWRLPAFDDSAWASGTAPIGYANPPNHPSEEALVTLLPSSAEANYLSVFFRKSFVVPNAGNISNLELDVNVDDGFVAWINGKEVGRFNVPDGELAYNSTASSTGEPTLVTLAVTNGLGAILTSGANVLAVQVFNSSTSSSDLLLDASLSSDADVTPPTVLEVVPAPGSTVTELHQIEVVFDAGVAGVDASDLLLNGLAATNLTVISPRDYVFAFAQPSAGPCAVAWAAGHGITDLAAIPNPFAGGTWTYTLNLAPPANNVLISEFLAGNEHGIRDDDSERSDWIELLNPGPLEVNLAGWFLTDNATNLTQWRFPAVALAANQYLLVWASEKNRTNPAAPLHTNFKLDKNGEFLALLDPQTNVVSAFSPRYPPQRADVSYGRDRNEPSLEGYYLVPTPGKTNTVSGPGFAPTPVVSLETGVFTNASLSVTVTAAAGDIRYTLDGNWPTNTSAAYTGPIVISYNSVLKVRVFQAGLLPSEIVARTYILADSTTANFTSSLPLMILTTAGKGIAENVGPGRLRTPGAILTIEPFRGRSAILGRREFEGMCELEVRGQTSSGFPKRPYNLEIQDEYRNDLSVPLLGLPSESDWALYNPYSDKPFLQNFLAFELHEKMGHYAVRRRFVELFLNTAKGKLTYPRDYAGIYMLVEKIKLANHRVDLERLGPEDTAEPDISGGYIFKKDKDSAGDKAFSTSGGPGFGGQLLKIHEPKPTEVTAAQLAWIKTYLNQFERALYSSNWLKGTGTNHYSWYIDADSFVDNHWIVEFSKQIDGYRLSSYFSKDRGGKVKMEPIWDYNLSFGNADYLEGFRTNGWYYTQLGDVDHIWLRRLINGTTSGFGKQGDPDFNQKIIDRWSQLRTNIFAATNVNARVDELAATLNEAAVRDFAKWPRLGAYIWPNPTFYVTPRTYAGIIDSMKTWISGRYAWIDTQFLRAPRFNLGGGPVPAGFNLAMTAPGLKVYYTLDGTDPRLPGGAISPAAALYAGPVPLTANARAFARAFGTNLWSGPTVATFVTETPRLAITELMYHPAQPPAGSTNTAGDFEFIEFANLGSGPLNLNGFRLSGDVEFLFPSTVLGAGQRVLVVKNRVAFATRYGTELPVAGEFAGSLSNGGGRLRLEGPRGEPILDFSYRDDWHPITDGPGFSLVVADERAPFRVWGSPSQWRPSRVEGGSPGQPDPPPPTAFPRVVISEALTHTRLPEVDAVEIQNLSPAEVDLSGWWLTDDLATPRKYRLKPGARLPAGGFKVLTEDDFNSPLSALVPFALSSLGDEVYLFSGDANGNLTGYLHGFAFGAQRSGVTFGRHVSSTGKEHFVAQAARTLGTANSGPLISPVVISEINYRPPDVIVNALVWNNTEDEYIELFNRGDAPVALFDLEHTNNTWRLRHAVEFDFPTNLTIPPGGYLLVVNFNPVREPEQRDRFVSNEGVPADVPIIGPYKGNLANGGERLSLLMPDSPEPSGPNAGATPYVVVEEVRYSSEPPWLAAPDGLGYSLHRRDTGGFADDPANWDASAPTPGRAYVPGIAPTIDAQPRDLRVAVSETAAFTPSVSGAGPFHYQWRFNGKNLIGETNATLTLTNVRPDQTGAYTLTVLSPGAAATTRPALLTVLSDADGDGMDDAWERAHGLNPALASDAASDLDHDGISNLDEYRFGTDPEDPRSGLRLSSIVVTDRVRLGFVLPANATCSLEYTDSLRPPRWLKLRDVAGDPAGGEVEVVEPVVGVERYYRLAARQPP